MSTRNGSATGRRSVRINIRDGFTLAGRVPPLAGVHDGLLFEYRPALPVRVMEYLSAPKPNAAKQLEAMVALLSEHVTTWEEEGAVSSEALRQVYYPVLCAMVDSVCGYSPADLEASLKNLPAVSP